MRWGTCIGVSLASFSLFDLARKATRALVEVVGQRVFLVSSREKDEEEYGDEEGCVMNEGWGDR